MFFKNAYELVKYLFNQEMLQGIYMGLRGEFSIETSLKNTKLIELLYSIFNDWNQNNESMEWNLDHGGFYSLEENEHGELVFDVSISDDLLDCDGHPFDIEILLSIICNELELKTPDLEDYLEYQICIELEIEYLDITSKSYEFNMFSIKCFEDDEIEQELKKKLNDQLSTKIMDKIAQHFAERHFQEYKNYYTSFSVKIEDNYFNEYHGGGFDTKEGLKICLEKNEICLAVETKDIF